MAKLRVEAFNERFRPDQGSAGPFVGWSHEDTLHLFGSEPALFTEFMRTQARTSYEEGLVCFFGAATDPTVFAWNGSEGWRASWPDVDGSLVVFAYDWMGRMYGLDVRRIIDREPLVGRLDPGDGLVRQSDLTFAEFVLGDLVAYGDRLLERDRFAAWRASGGEPLRGSDVVGYVAPLFNAGTDALTNMEKLPLRRYVERTGLADAARRGVFREGGARQKARSR